MEKDRDIDQQLTPLGARRLFTYLLWEIEIGLDFWSNLIGCRTECEIIRYDALLI